MSREAFEAWALRNTSLSSAHDIAWAAWQAALAQPQAEPDDSGCIACVMCGAPAAPAPAQCAYASEVDMLPGECWIRLEAQALRARDWGDAEPVPAVPVSWDRLRVLMDGIPTREEFIGGQRQKYVAKEAVMGWLYEGQLRAEREAASAPVPPVALTPLTDAQIKAILMDQPGLLAQEWFFAFARAIEQAHGIAPGAKE